MKYIRTEYEIRLATGNERTRNVELRNVEFEVKEVGFFDKNGKERFISIDLPYFKTADTVEELCDEFVVSYDKGTDNCAVFDSFANAKTQYHEFIYGAIWTEWGLKYVARMKNKGEWVLL